MKNKVTGLRQQIANAKNDSEITSLLKLGATFKYASNRTRLSWAKTAARRRMLGFK